MRFLELKVPPPLVLLIVACAMWLVAKNSPLLAAPFMARLLFALTIGLAGLAVVLTAVVSFRRARTTISPFSPDESTSLISTGIFSWSRNPIYLGGAILLLGWAVYLAAPPALLGPFMFVLYINRFQILPEERALAARFGSSFAEYKTRVRRWL